VLPVQGINVYDILRRDKLVLTKAASKRWRRGSNERDPKHYDVIRRPVITEKATMASEHNQVVFNVAQGRHQARDQGGGRGAVRRQGEGVNTLVRKGKVKRFRGALGPSERRQEGGRDARRGPAIDVTTGSERAGRRADESMALKHYKPTRRASASWFSSTAPELYKGKPVKSLTEGSPSPAGATTPAASRAHRGGGHKRPTASSTSSAASSTCRRRSSGSSTIPTAPPSSR
jgi:large subunit ribosomal protein L23